MATKRKHPFRMAKLAREADRAETEVAIMADDLSEALGEVYGGYWVVDLDLEAGIVILNRVEVAIERENCRIV